MCVVSEGMESYCFVCWLLDVETHPPANQGEEPGPGRATVKNCGSRCLRLQSGGVWVARKPGKPLLCGKLPVWRAQCWGLFSQCPRDNKDFRKDSPASGLKEALVPCLAA